MISARQFMVASEKRHKKTINLWKTDQWQIISEFIFVYEWKREWFGDIKIQMTCVKSDLIRFQSNEQLNAYQLMKI